MRLSELIERLEELRDDLHAGLGEDCDPIVLAATQPHWPLTGSLQSALVLDDYIVNGEPVVWLAIGSAPDDVSPYAPKDVFEA